MKPLIISADDFAQSEAIDAGITALIAQGRLSATSCLVLSPRWAEASQRLSKDLRQQADIGLHLDFTEYAHAQHRALSRTVLRSLLRSLPLAQLRAVIHAQLDAFEHAMGTSPDYVDGHQHVHQLPQIRDCLLQILQQRYAGHLPWLRIARPPASDGLKARIIGNLGGNQLTSLAERGGFRHTQHLLGVYAFDGDSAQYALKLAGWLQQAANSIGVAALMCHPAQSQAGIQAVDPIYQARLQEFEVFSGPLLPKLLKQYGIQPARGSALQSPDANLIK